MSKQKSIESELEDAVDHLRWAKEQVSSANSSIESIVMPEIRRLLTEGKKEEAIALAAGLPSCDCRQEALAAAYY